MPQAQLRDPVTVIAYGDTRFTDPSHTSAANAPDRQALVKRIAKENPDALLINGDAVWHGGDPADYGVLKDETLVWREAHLRVFPALGNHEFSKCDVPQCLENWWRAFPDLKGRRWYSVALGASLYLIVLDSNDSLLPGSEQHRWLEKEIAALPADIRFVLIAMHHPPVADFETEVKADHNPRPNEIALAEYLRNAASRSRAKFVVIAGHLHNYERFSQDGIVYLVSGGGGAHPDDIARTPPDLYKGPSFPNYHYVKFVLLGHTLRGTMYRLSDASPATWEVKDRFEIPPR